MKRRSSPKSKNRLRLLTLSKELTQLTSDLVNIQVITKGTVYTQTKKCGNNNCKCARGQLHSMKVLSFSHKSKTRSKSLTQYSPSELFKIEKQVENYRRFRQIRAKAALYYKRFLETVNILEENITKEI